MLTADINPMPVVCDIFKNSRAFLLYFNVALILCQICVLALLLIARARVVSVEKALIDLDWESSSILREIVNGLGNQRGA